MTKCRKIVSLLLAVLMLTAIFVTTAVSAYAAPKEESKFNVELLELSSGAQDSIIDPASLRLPEIEAPENVEGGVPRVSPSYPGGITLRVETDGFDGDAESKDFRYLETEDRPVRLSYDGQDRAFFWEIDGNYELVEGELTDPEIVIKPCKDSDIRAFARCHKHERATCDEATSDQSTSTTSPQTGDMTVLYIMIVLAAAAVCVFAVKKIKE